MSQDSNLSEKLSYFHGKIISWEKVIFIGFNPTADALIAATILGKVFIDRETPFVISATKSPEQEIKDRRSNVSFDDSDPEDHHHFIFIGHSSKIIEQLPTDLDYFAILKEDLDSQHSNIFTPTEFGFSYPEITYTSMAYEMSKSLITHTVGTKEYLLPLTLVAHQAIFPKSEFIGKQLELLEEARKLDLISEQKTLSFLGGDIFSISEALFYCQDPFLPNLTDNEKKVTQLLGRADIVPENRDGPRKMSDLSQDELRDLNSELVTYLSSNSGFKTGGLELIKTKISLVQDEGVAIVNNTWDYAKAIIDVINRNRYNIAILVLLGNRRNKLQELRKVFVDERKLLTASYDFLEDKQDKVVELSNLRYLVTDDKISWYNATSIAAMALAGKLVNIDLPFALIVPGPKDQTTIGIRTTSVFTSNLNLQQLLQDLLKGLDLPNSVNGDNFSASCSIPSDSWKKVIEELDKELS